ncbi:protein kinase domain protein [Stylonychia lemnae]|uniref:Protein kinase domain protein n=1 Tax=Stylonychia lemnae TaxID=5949 RepID=A0A078AA32_STYLE|nr:protein kinase domain protein [Stylonychia lemnae]|eukprot:CDW78412.1 protein kinase domain protein [Stylonychia lemnae]
MKEQPSQVSSRNSLELMSQKANQGALDHYLNVEGQINYKQLCPCMHKCLCILWYLNSSRKQQASQKKSIDLTRFRAEINVKENTFILHCMENSQTIVIKVNQQNNKDSQLLGCHLEKYCIITSPNFNETYTLGEYVCKGSQAKIYKCDKIQTCQGEESQTKSHKVGTPGYIAPEVFQTHEYDNKVDVFSIGCIFYLMLYGKNLVDAWNIDNLIKMNKVMNPGKIIDCQFKVIPEACKNLLKLLVHKDPQQRVTAQDALMDEWFLPFKNEIIKALFLNMLASQPNQSDNDRSSLNLKNKCFTPKQM